MRKRTRNERSLDIAKPKRHHVEFTSRKTIKEPTEVKFKTKSGDRVDFTARKPMKEEVEVSFMARNKVRK